MTLVDLGAQVMSEVREVLVALLVLIFLREVLGRLRKRLGGLEKRIAAESDLRA